MKKILIGVVALFALTACNPSGEALNCGDINEVRSASSLTALTRLESLDNKALGHSKEMADAGQIYHSDDLYDNLPAGWKSAAENVASAPTLDAAQRALEASPDHYLNMTNPSFTHVGIGSWEGSDGNVYLVQVFVEL